MSAIRIFDVLRHVWVCDERKTTGRRGIWTWGVSRTSGRAVSRMGEDGGKVWPLRSRDEGSRRKGRGERAKPFERASASVGIDRGAVAMLSDIKIQDLPQAMPPGLPFALTQTGRSGKIHIMSTGAPSSPSQLGALRVRSLLTRSIFIDTLSTVYARPAARSPLVWPRLGLRTSWPGAMCKAVISLRVRDGVHKYSFGSEGGSAYCRKTAWRDAGNR